MGRGSSGGETGGLERERKMDGEGKRGGGEEGEEEGIGSSIGIGVEGGGERRRGSERVKREANGKHRSKRKTKGKGEQTPKEV